MAKKKEQVQGSVDRFAQHRRHILKKNTAFIVQEAYKSLRTNVRFLLKDSDHRRFCITSGSAGEGKSITMLNLAISIAETGKKVLLIDADLRRPAIARLLVEEPNPGLSTVLGGMAMLEDTIRKDVYPNLDILFSGEVPPNPQVLLGSPEMENLIEEVSKQYDYVLVDTPPINVVHDTCVIANLLDGVLLLVWQDRTSKDSVRRALSNLQMTGANVLGYVLNGTKIESKRYYGYYY